MLQTIIIIVWNQSVPRNNAPQLASGHKGIPELSLLRHLHSRKSQDGITTVAWRYSCMTKQWNLESCPNWHSYKSESASADFWQVVTYRKTVVFQHRVWWEGEQSLWHWTNCYGLKNCDEDMFQSHKAMSTTGQGALAWSTHALVRVTRPDKSHNDLCLILPICKTL